MRGLEQLGQKVFFESSHYCYCLCQGNIHYEIPNYV